MLTWAVSSLLCACLQAPEAPFTTDLADDYPAFQPVEAGQGETWVSLRADEAAQYEVRRIEVAAAGALPESVAENLRISRWQPLLRDVGHEIKDWTGTWSGRAAAGHRIEYVIKNQTSVVIQRLTVIDVYLYIATWEGGLADSVRGQSGLDSIQFSPAWLPEPAPHRDSSRGLGPLAETLPSSGHVIARVDASQPGFGTVRFHLKFDETEDGPKPSTDQWLLPPGAKLVEQSRLEVKYEVELYDEDSNPTPSAGLTAGPSCLAGFGTTWMAMPASLAAEGGRFAPPEVSLTVICPAFLSTLSDVPIQDTVVEDNSKTTEFQRRRGNTTWPIFAIGYFQLVEESNRKLAIRRSATAVSSRGALQALDRLSQVAQRWLPASQTDWSALTFPGANDQVFTGLLVFDEANRWLQDPVDGPWIDGNRRAGLARKIGYLLFGRQLQGRGNGRAFLEASLSEYAAWRLLEAAGASAEANAMVKFWVENERALGELTRPLTLLPWEELTGPRRLMSRGGMVWRALEARAGRAKLDQVLNRRLAQGGSWTTEDLRADLEAATELKWLEWFDQHVYGRILP